MASYPKDRFDDLPKRQPRVGAHRAPKKKGGALAAFIWTALATVVVTIAGLFAVVTLTGVPLQIPGLPAPEETAAAPEPLEPAAPTVEPVTDPSTIDPAREITITVLNGSGVEGQQETAGDQLAESGWPVGARAMASTSDISTTTVYYSNPADEDIARGLVEELGIGEIRESLAFLGAPVTIVLGSDYVPSR